MVSERASSEIDDALRGLTVYDVSVGRASRTRERCFAAMAARRPSERAGRGARAWGSWLEPLAAVVLGAVYLAAAIRASTVLLLLGPVR